jgi:hypothetical protein
MKVYIVESDFGCYEDYTKVINGVYARPEVAEIERQKIQDYYQEILDKGDPSEKMMDWENMPDEEYERLNEMLENYETAIDYNTTTVTEYDVVD